MLPMVVQMVTAADIDLKRDMRVDHSMQPSAMEAAFFTIQFKR
jgi:hypothetical protein